ncbi:MAG: S4 domain-containing protein [Candidatus Zixiibacteriota bacterium]
MRIDDYLSTVGIIKRRTVAKELGANGLIEVNGQKVKPAYQVKLRDIIAIKGSRPFTAEVLDIPSGSVARGDRDRYFREIKRM